MKLLIDWSVMCHINWHKMANPDYEARTDIEQAEFARNLAGAIVYYKERFKPEETIFALDGSDYWRYEAYNTYYAQNSQVFVEKIEAIPDETEAHLVYYFQYDYKTIKLEYHTGMEKWIKTKLKKAEVQEFGEKQAHGIIAVASPIPAEIMLQLPQYKGDRRESKWDYTTTRKEFKLMCNNIAKNLARTLDARAIQVDRAEADDIAYLYHKLHGAEDMVYITTDSDWNQLLRNGLFLKFFNPMKFDWVDISDKQASLDLAIKIVGGDSSDGICGLSLKGKQTIIGPKNAEKIVLEHGVPGVYTYLKEQAEPNMLRRNLQLIYLENCPKKVKKAIRSALSEKPAKVKKHELSDYGIDAKDLLTIQASAEEARSVDLEEGRYHD